MKSDSHSSFKKRIAASFGAKVAGYNDYAVFQNHILDRLLPDIANHSSGSGLWLDAGCGNGILERKLSSSPFCSPVIALDIAIQSLIYGKKLCYPASLWLCADIEILPFKSRSFDGVVAASVLQWANNLENTIASLSKILVNGGCFIYSMFTSDAFSELNQIRRRFNLPLALRLPDRDTIARYLKNAQLRVTTMESVESTMYFPSAWQLLKHLSAIGSTSVPSEQMSRTALLQFCRVFEDTFGTAQGVPLTYAACIGSAKKESTDV